GPCQRRERLGDVDADDDDVALGQCVGVPPRAAPHVEDAISRGQPERLDQEPDLLLRALGERVAQVRRPHVVGQRLEPMVGLAHPLASAQLVPHVRLTSRGTHSSHALRMAWSTMAAALSFPCAGTSRMTSSCPWRMSRLARPCASRAWSRRTNATLKMSAARPWMPAFMAWRSPAWRMRKLPDASSGIWRRRPNSVSVYPRSRASN